MIGLSPRQFAFWASWLRVHRAPAEWRETEMRDEAPQGPDNAEHQWFRPQLREALERSYRARERSRELIAKGSRQRGGA